MSSVVINLTLAAENNARMGQYIFCKETCKSNPKSSKSIQLFSDPKVELSWCQTGHLNEGRALLEPLASCKVQAF